MRKNIGLRIASIKSKSLGFWGKFKRGGNVTDVVLFNGINALDFQDIRDNVIRIPEVSTRIREAQDVWDALSDSEFSFYNFLVSEDSVYLSNIKLKSLLTSIVQVGLYDRYARKFGRPEYAVGMINGDSPLSVCLGELSFEDMILGSQAAQPSLPLVALSPVGEPVLSGISLAEMGVFRANEDTGKYERFEEDKQDLSKIINLLIEGCGVQKFVNVGPGSSVLEPVKKDLSMRDVQVIESIDADPMLNWFWPELRRSNEKIQIAQ